MSRWRAPRPPTPAAVSAAAVRWREGPGGKVRAQRPSRWWGWLRQPQWRCTVLRRPHRAGVFSCSPAEDAVIQRIARAADAAPAAVVPGNQTRTCIVDTASAKPGRRLDYMLLSTHTHPHSSPEGSKKREGKKKREREAQESPTAHTPTARARRLSGTWTRS